MAINTAAVSSDGLEHYDPTDAPPGESDDLIGEWEPLTEFTWAKVLVYGPSGAGKTVFASTWPNVVFIDFEGGMASVRTHVARVPARGPRATYQDLVGAYGYLKQGKHPYETVVLDPLNELQDLLLQNVLKSFDIKRPYGNQPTLADYGKMLADFERIIRRFLALPMHVVLTCASTTPQFPDQPVTPQLLGRATTQKVARLCDMVGYLSIQQTETGFARMLRFTDPIHLTKDRYGVPAQLTDATFKLLNQRIQEALRD